MNAPDHFEHTDTGEGEAGRGAERVTVRDRRRVDPVTGEVRVPAGDEPAGPAPAPPADTGDGTDATDDGDRSQAAPAPDGATSVAEAELAAQVDERTADLQRVTAEYANYRRRVDRDRESVLVSARVQFAGELLTVLDDLERAAAHGDLTGAFKSVGDKVVGAVRKLGLEPFGDEGEPFDPAVHEAVQHEESDVTGPSTATVSTVLRRGYRLADRVLRPAMVTVVDRPAGPSDATGVEPGGPGRADGDAAEPEQRS